MNKNRAALSECCPVLFFPPHPLFHILTLYLYSLYRVYFYARRRIMRAGAREIFCLSKILSKILKIALDIQCVTNFCLSKTANERFCLSKFCISLYFNVLYVLPKQNEKAWNILPKQNKIIKALILIVL
ncbi:hypothetical protein EEL33_04200 [Muribaculaceae bacterium Isolate-037 (Harlan)]|nr:hypothetical protein EEL33_04200 [Muribaculaceae bacterium Isolate-037 (Harlan)]